MTGGQSFPASVQAQVQNGALQYDCNTIVVVHAARRPRDAERDLGLGSRPRARAIATYAIYRGKTAAVEVRQTKADGYQPELSVMPNPGADVVAVHGAVERRLPRSRPTYPAVSC